MTKTKTVISRVPEALKKAFQEKAKKQGMSESEAIRYAIRKWVES